jgi:ketosteroid isomerase-like protein
MYYGDVDERRATIGAHDRIVEAVRSRDADLLVAELDAHRQRALDVLRDVLDTDNPSARKVNMTDNGRIEILEEVVEGFNRHDLDAIMAHFADDCEFDSSRGPERWGRRFTGKDEVRKGLGALFESTPDVHFGDDRHFVSGNRGLSEWTITGTTADGDRIDLRGCDLWTFDDDGKIVRKDSFMKRPVDTTTGR